MERIKALQESIEKMRLDTIKMKNDEIITPMGKSYCNARIQAFNDVLEVISLIKEVKEDESKGNSHSSSSAD